MAKFEKMQQIINKYNKKSIAQTSKGKYHS